MLQQPNQFLSPRPSKNTGPSSTCDEEVGEAARAKKSAAAACIYILYNKEKNKRSRTSAGQLVARSARVQRLLLRYIYTSKGFVRVFICLSLFFYGHAIVFLHLPLYARVWLIFFFFLRVIGERLREGG